MSAPAFFNIRLRAVAEAANMTPERLLSRRGRRGNTLRDWLFYAHLVVGHPGSRVAGWMGLGAGWPNDAVRRLIGYHRAGDTPPPAVAEVVAEGERDALRRARLRMPERVLAVAAREALIARLPLVLVLSPATNRELTGCRARIYAALHVPRRTSLPRIAQWFNRDHTTIEYALSKHAARNRAAA